MNLGKSLEDYLETVLILQNKQGCVRSVDIACYMNFSKPSVCHAVKVLKEKGLLSMDQDGFLYLTEQGKSHAERIYERHQFFTEQLIAAGVDKVTAEQDACRIEHAISDESFQKLKNAIGSGGKQYGKYPGG